VAYGKVVPQRTELSTLILQIVDQLGILSVPVSSRPAYRQYFHSTWHVSFVSRFSCATYFPAKMSFNSKTGVSIVLAPCLRKMFSSVLKICFRSRVAEGPWSRVPWCHEEHIRFQSGSLL
jgi:hypothetical protein